MWRQILLVITALSSTFANPLTACDKLETAMVQEFTAFSRDAIHDGVQLLQRVLKEAELLGPSTEDRVAMDRLFKFIVSAKHADEFEDIMMLIGELEELLDLDDEVSKELVDVEDDLIGKLLRQLGFDTFEKNLEKNLALFMKRTESHIEAYLMRVKLFEDSKLPTWFTEFQNEIDIEAKLFLFDEVLDKLDC